MHSVMNHNFSQIPAPQIQRSTFDRSSGLKTAFNSGYLVPIFLDEILPGDTLKMVATFLARLSTFIFPIMDNVFLDTFFFYVPCRLLWSNWEKFNGAQNNPADSTSFLIPTVKIYGAGASNLFPANTIYDYMGLPTEILWGTALLPSALPFRAYNLIWNEWFRDQNLQNSVPKNLGDGPDNNVDYQILKRGKYHDYFTSCLPWPQKGASVSLPLGTTAPVKGNGMTIGMSDSIDTTMGMYHQLGSDALRVQTTAGSFGSNVGSTYAAGVPTSLVNRTVGLTTDSSKSGMVADLSAASAATINQIRQAYAFQKILERDARGGTRYVEMLKAHFGVTSPDFRLQRPEYLGGSSQRMNVSQVQQTSETATTPQGKLSAYTSGHSQMSFNKSFVEHGYILGLINVRADISYQNGLNKLFSRSTRFDFYLPALAHLGEQAVLTKEIFFQDDAHADLVFGYQERWAEYRYKPSMVTGPFKSNAPVGTLDSWHLALDFGATAPLLNASFIQDAPPLDRVIAVSEAAAPQIILDSYFSMKHTRPMPTYSVPGQLDRF